MKREQDIINLTKRILGILFCVSLVFLFLRPDIFKVRLPFLSISMTSVKNLAILMGTLWAVFFALRRFRIERKTIIDKGIVIFLLWFIITCIFAENIRLSVNSLFVMLVYISFYFVCSEVLSKGEKVKMVFYLLLACSSVVSVGNLVSHFKIGISTVIERYPFWPGKQAISLFLVLAFLVIGSVTIFNWRKMGYILKTVCILSLAVQSGCLVSVYSRGAWISLLFSLLIVSVLKSKKIFYLVISLLFCFILLLFIGLFHNRFYSFFNIQDDNISQRFSIWETTMVLIKENPIIGVGPGNFGSVHLERYRKGGDKFGWWGENYHAHNLYLQIASESGIIGLFIFIYLIWKIIKGGYYLICVEKDPFMLGMRIGVFSAFLGFLFWSIAECTYTGEFSPSSFFHINLVILLYINLILYPIPVSDDKRA